MITLQQIEKYFITNGIPEGKVKIDSCATVTDPVKFVESSIATLKTNTGKHIYKPYFTRLFKYYEIVK